MEDIILLPIVDIEINQIDIRPHALKRGTIQEGWIYNVILNKKPLGVLKTKRG